MAESVMYHEGNRRLQDQFDSRRISDRLEKKLTRTEFTAEDKNFIEGVPYFFLTTADEATVSDCDPLLSEAVGAQLIVRVMARANDAIERTFDLCPSRRMRRAGACVEAICGFQRLRSSTSTHFQRLTVTLASLGAGGRKPGVNSGDDREMTPTR
ncbi:hypothetical protein JQ596_30315 [Bradyrhizobium manausense]|uniref:hypothetical protein n=1 Tax=Bradyrhizobium manausense TaxID=989370 RepID=UPI001BA999B2|nr:hypothetical protein [Bradyrhizobium manausense]MBR0829832.1 hypothetical protein [Bradyrhizobium manausense]